MVTHYKIPGNTCYTQYEYRKVDKVAEHPKSKSTQPNPGLLPHHERRNTPSQLEDEGGPGRGGHRAHGRGRALGRRSGSGRVASEASKASEAAESILCVGDRGCLRRRRDCRLPSTLDAAVVAVGRGEKQRGARRTLRLFGGILGKGRKGLRESGVGWGS